jgi:hypothetical protein
MLELSALLSTLFSVHESDFLDSVFFLSVLKIWFIYFFHRIFVFAVLA